jgi:ABC-type antimicrobial peptide transport system permease subunit
MVPNYGLSFLDSDTTSRRPLQQNADCRAFVILAISSLVSLGLYGLVSYIVDRRYTEIGIRFALGAPRFSVLVSLLYDALSTVVIGIMVCAPIAWGATHVLAARYVDIERYSAGGILGALLILMFAAFFSGYLPAVQATRIDPTSALRRE